MLSRWPDLQSDVSSSSEVEEGIVDDGAEETVAEDEEVSVVGDGVLLEAEAAMLEAILSASTELEVASAELDVTVEDTETDEEMESVTIDNDEDESDSSETSTFIALTDGAGEEVEVEVTVTVVVKVSVALLERDVLVFVALTEEDSGRASSTLTSLESDLKTRVLPPDVIVLAVSLFAAGASTEVQFGLNCPELES